MSKADMMGRGHVAKHFRSEPRSWEDINQSLACLGEMERQIRALRDQFDEKVAVLKQQWLESSRPVVREKQKMEDQIARFYWAHREEVLAAGRKSVELHFGRVGTRRSRSVMVEDAAAAQQWLSSHGLSRFLRLRTEIDREALRLALLPGNSSARQDSLELLRCPGIRLRDREEFWYEVDITRCGLPLPVIRAESSQECRRSRVESETATAGVQI